MHPPLPHDALTDGIVRQLDELAGHLSQADPRQAAQILTRVLDTKDGVLGRMLHLVVTSTFVAQRYAETGVYPAEVWLALSRTVNTLGNLAIDHLDEQHAALGRITAQAGSDTAGVKATALVTRRHR
ncbi:hypothetical protein ACGFRB_23380 [Streptomyces sp. NPDC048718]|uniref:hypothetical protein n=1 Tax=Streptomyces sp. NPDC048718 TaxID=3365587 RepID=UPI003714CF83